MKPRILKSMHAALGGGLAIALLTLLSIESPTLWLMAPFGASCVLLFAAPASPFSQPKNVIFGHGISTLVGVVLVYFFANTSWLLALAVALAIGLMVFFEVVHPPAGADPIVVILGSKGVSFLLFPVLSGSFALVVLAMLFHRFKRSTQYPASC